MGATIFRLSFTRTWGLELFIISGRLTGAYKKAGCPFVFRRKTLLITVKIFAACDFFVFFEGGDIPTHGLKPLNV